MKFLSTSLIAVAMTLAGSASANVIVADPLTFTADKQKAAEFKLDKTYAGNVLVDFMLSYTGSLISNSFTGLWFGDWNGPNIGLKANCGGSAKAPCEFDDVFARTTGESGAFVANSDLKANTKYHLVGYLQKTGGSDFYNQFDVWLNPVSMDIASLIGTSHASYSGLSSLSSFNTMGFRTVNVTGRTVTVDDVRLNQIPEPGSVSLMGLALAGIGISLRRRRS